MEVIGSRGLQVGVGRGWRLFMAGRGGKGRKGEGGGKGGDGVSIETKFTMDGGRQYRRPN
jgi:hypothetical protein